MRPAGLLLALIACAAAAAGRAQAHGFAERYDLPVPLASVVAAACAAVALTFVAAALFARRGPVASGRSFGLQLTLPRAAQVATRALAWALYVLAIAAALFGSRDPLMNLAPTLVWIVWWVGMSFAAALVGDVWALLDPWRTTFDVLNSAARRFGRPAGIALGWRWPAAVGVWPSVALLLGWCWLEVVYPLASSPLQLGCAALLWSGVSLAGMAAFGRAAWQNNADVFALVFATLGRMAPLRLRIAAPAAASAAAQQPTQEPPQQPTQPQQAAAGQVGLVMALLSTVIFDGLHGGAAWTVFEAALRNTLPRLLDVNGFVAGTLGLLSVWLVFMLAYLAMAHWSLALMPPGLPRPCAAALAITLVPIALAYNVAHNFSSLLVQGQTVLQLLSDPFGRQWDLFGSARWYPDIGIVDARLTWFVAVSAIVLGHAASIWWSHRVVLAGGVPARRAAVATLPLTLLMLACTATSLTLIAEPMVVSP